MNKRFKKKLILFDLDGVLINSKKNMQTAWQIVQREFDLKIPFNHYFAHIGEPFQKILKKINVKNNTEKIENLYRLTSANHLHEVKFYKGVEQTLINLKNRKLKIGIVTSKDIYRTNSIISKLVKFDIVSSPKKGLRGKPSPDQLLFSMAKCNCDPEETIYLGDMKVDMEAANRAKIEFIQASWGYGKFKSKYSLNSFSELEDLII